MRLAILSLALAYALPAQAEDLQSLTREAQALIPPLQQALLASVQQAMRDGGPQAAVTRCQVQAPLLTRANSPAPWRVGRTALRVRNPDNAADAWEREVLERFAQRAAAGEALQGMHESAVIDGQFRYLQAIPTGEPCLACHGPVIPADLAERIDRLYPADQARGFRLGELRGAFTLSRPLESP